MKKFINYIVASVLLHSICLVACSDKETEPEVAPSISITTNSLETVDQKGGTLTIQFNSTKDWTATSGQSWCTLSATSGRSGNVTLNVTVSENSTFDERNSNITIQSGTVSKSLTITQKQKDALTITSHKYEVSSEGETVGVEIKSNVEYSYEIDDNAKEWISIASSRAYTTSSLTFNVAPNEEFEKREGNIIIKSADFTETVTIYQEGSKPVIVLTKNEYTVGSEGETIAIEIKSNITYEMVLPKDVDWVRLEESRAVSTYTHYLVVEPNTGYEGRNMEVLFVNKENNLSEKVRINQVQKDAILVAQNEYTLDAITTELNFEINTNVEFEVKISTDWIEQNIESRALQTYPLNFIIQENVTTENREGVISIESEDLRQEIKVVQKGRVDKSSVSIVHTNLLSSVPHIIGKYLVGTISWGDNQKEEYATQAIHQYTSEGKWTMLIETWGSETIEFNDLVGIEEIDLTEF